MNTGTDNLLVNEAILYIPLVLGLVIPMITEAITKSSAPTAVKSGVAFALSLLLGAVATVGVGALSEGSAGLVDYFSAILLTWLVSGRAYLAGLANPVIASNPNRGVGSADGLS